MKTLGLLFQAFFAILNILFGGTLILAGFAGSFSPEESVIMPYLGLAFPFFLIVNILFLFYWLIRKQWLFCLISLLALGASWNAISRYCPYHSRTAIENKKTIKVLTYNVMGFAFRDHTAKIKNPILTYIADSKADIVCLQEYWTHNSCENLCDEKIKGALSMYPYRKLALYREGHRTKSGLAIYSKFPLSNEKYLRFKDSGNGLMSCEININGKKFFIVNCHLQSFQLTSLDKEKYKKIVTDFAFDNLNEVKTEVNQKFIPTFKQRAHQAEYVHSIIEKVKQPYIIICGDFNDTPLSYTHTTVQGDLTDAFMASGKGFGASYNQNKYYFRIDNILNSKNITPYNCTVGNKKYSDHYPMWCNMEIH